jgi:hypothetical protein
MATIDLRVKWADAMPILILCLTHGTEAGKKQAEAELLELARKLDTANFPKARM